MYSHASQGVRRKVDTCTNSSASRCHGPACAKECFFIRCLSRYILFAPLWVWVWICLQFHLSQRGKSDGDGVGDDDDENQLQRKVTGEVCFAWRVLVLFVSGCTWARESWQGAQADAYESLFLTEVTQRCTINGACKHVLTINKNDFYTLSICYVHAVDCSGYFRFTPFTSISSSLDFDSFSLEFSFSSVIPWGIYNRSC